MITYYIKVVEGWGTIYRHIRTYKTYLRRETILKNLKIKEKEGRTIYIRKNVPFKRKHQECKEYSVEELNYIYSHRMDGYRKISIALGRTASGIGSIMCFYLTTERAKVKRIRNKATLLKMVRDKTKTLDDIIAETGYTRITILEILKTLPKPIRGRAMYKKRRGEATPTHRYTEADRRYFQKHKKEINDKKREYRRKKAAEYREWKEKFLERERKKMLRIQNWRNGKRTE